MIVYIYDSNNFIANKPPICIVSCDLIIRNGIVRLSKNERVFEKIELSNEDHIFITDHFKIILSNPLSNETIEKIKNTCENQTP